MLKVDYSDDVLLLPYEADDYDTKDARAFLEMDEEPPAGIHPTEINRTRMRLPERYDIAKYYARLRRNKNEEWLNPVTDEYETVKRRAGEYGSWKNKRKKDLPDITSISNVEWQITYNFPDTLHNNVSENGYIYGGETVTYRRLYLILCERFNQGEFFVDTYFRDVYPHSVKEEVDVALLTVKDELRMYKYDVVLNGAKLTRKGNLDKRATRINEGYEAKLQEYESFKESWENKKGDELADLIAYDIQRALANGEIPLNATHTPETERKRLEAGYDAKTVFYAMGDLIDHIQLYVKIRS